MKQIIFLFICIILTTTTLFASSTEWTFNESNKSIEIYSIEDSLFSLLWNCTGLYYTIDTNDTKTAKEIPDRIDVAIGNRFVYFNKVDGTKRIKYTPHYKEDTLLIKNELINSEILYFNNPNYQPLSFNTKGFAEALKKMHSTCKK